MTDSKMVRDRPVFLSTDELDSLREVGKGDAQRDIPQLHWERLVALGYALRRLGALELTEAGKRRLVTGVLELMARSIARGVIVCTHLRAGNRYDHSKRI